MGVLVSVLGIGFMGALLSTTTTSSSRGRPQGTHGTHIIHFPDHPTTLNVKKSDAGDKEHASLSALVEKWCPSLFREFKPLWWLSKCVLPLCPSQCPLNNRGPVVTFRHFTVFWATFQEKIAWITFGTSRPVVPEPLLWRHSLLSSI
jgi:hypothetical protein